MGAARIWPSLEFPDRGQSRSAHDAIACRFFRETACGRHIFPTWRGAADPAGHYARRRRCADRRSDGVHRRRHPVFYSALLAAISIFAALLHLALVFALFPAMRYRMEEEILARAKEQSHLMETVRAATTVKLMGREAERESAWRNLYADVTNAGVSVGKYQITTGFIQTLITGLVYVIIVYLGARLILNGQGFSVGMLFAFLSFRQTFNDRAIGLVNQLVQFRLLGLHLDRLADIVTAAPESEAVKTQHL